MPVQHTMLLVVLMLLTVAACCFLIRSVGTILNNVLSGSTALEADVTFSG